MRGFAKAFYLSPEWRRVREYVYQRDAGLCVRCGGLGEIVHHKTPLTPGNISDTAIALGESNLELLCRECHGRAHAHASALGEGLAFDESGNVVRLDECN
ncbi:HNH endonuclease [Clostridiaceae bacterium]|nr:HNH endonuclease [Clostridiaceae bacterium]